MTGVTEDEVGTSATMFVSVNEEGQWTEGNRDQEYALVPSAEAGSKSAAWDISGADVSLSAGGLVLGAAKEIPGVSLVWVRAATSSASIRCSAASEECLVGMSSAEIPSSVPGVVSIDSSDSEDGVETRGTSLSAEIIIRN